MKFDDVRKLATGTILFNLHRIISPRLVTIVYLLGLTAIVLWAVNHFFFTFSFGFGSGLWGLLEIAVFGLLAMLVLRIACEAVIVWFKAHATEAAQATKPLATASLFDDVRGAIEELADEEPEIDDAPIVTPPPPSSQSPAASDPTPPPAKQNTPTPPPPGKPATPPVSKAAAKPANAKPAVRASASKAPAKAAPKKRARTTKPKASGIGTSTSTPDQT